MAAPTPDSGIYQHLFPYLLGVFLGVAFIYAARRMRSDERWFLTWVMGLVVFGFIGFPLSTGHAGGAIVEAAILIGLGGVLAASWKLRSTVLLAVVYLAHGTSDVVHLLTDISPASPNWIHEFCIPFDWIVGGHVLTRRSIWSPPG